NFSIYKNKFLRLVSPNGGESITSDTTLIIWTSVNIANVGLQYSLNNGYSWTQIVVSTPSTGSFRWTIPTETSTLARIRVYDVSDSATYNDMSDSYFSLNSVPVSNVRIDNPKANEKSSSERIISWEGSAQLKRVKLEYSLDSGKNWILIEDNYSSTKGSNKFTWKYSSNIDVNKIIVKVSDKDSNFYKTASPKQ
ncbi:MAG: hypothetical protein M0P61_05670, partial [Ignavibacteriaceae bacterium]|nr:hypothetical protein [Ignavibacteriaceae bacterium]